jgi:hypothetical protein
MEHPTHLWLDQIVAALADARAVLGPFGLHQPSLIAQINEALRRAEMLKQRSVRL